MEYLGDVGAVHGAEPTGIGRYERPAGRGWGRFAHTRLLIAVFCLGSVATGEALAQGAAHPSVPTLTLGLAAGMLEPTCSGCGAQRVRSSRTLLASLDLPLARVPVAVTLRGLLFSSRGRQLGAAALGVEGMLFGRRWVRVGAGIGGGAFRDSVLAIAPPNGTPRPAWVTALAPIAEVHAVAALPLLRHVELGPVVGYVTSFGGFTAFPVTSDRALLYWGAQLTLH